MRDMIYAILTFVLFFVLLYGSYARFAMCMIRWTKKPIKVRGKKGLQQPPLTGKEKLVCCIPIWQVVVVRKALYRRGGIFQPLCIAAIAFILFNLFVSFVLPISALVMLIGHLLMYVGILLHFIVYGIVTADAARLYSFSKLCIVLNFLFPHIACVHMVNNVPHIMLDMRKSKTFEEDNGDTVIKQKPNK